MRSAKKWIALLVLAALFGLAPSTLLACPLCAEAVSASNSGSDDDETSDFPAAMNQSIYLMVGVPYLALGFGGFLVYRGCKKNAAFRQAADASPPRQQGT